MIVPRGRMRARTAGKAASAIRLIESKSSGPRSFLWQGGKRPVVLEGVVIMDAPFPALARGAGPRFLEHCIIRSPPAEALAGLRAKSAFALRSSQREAFG